MIMLNLHYFSSSCSLLKVQRNPREQYYNSIQESWFWIWRLLTSTGINSVLCMMISIVFVCSLSSILKAIAEISLRFSWSLNLSSYSTAIVRHSFNYFPLKTVLYFTKTLLISSSLCLDSTPRIFAAISLMILVNYSL